MHRKTTKEQAEQVIAGCFQIFSAKLKDYGTAWRILRMTSLTDQIYIKAQRIRTIEEKGIQKVDDSVESEFIGIINYSIIALIQLELGVANQPDLSEEQARQLYSAKAKSILELMDKKNHDYGEAWREMRISSYTDLILQKLMRIKQIEENSGKTLISEGLEGNYMDIVNYSIFALIRLSEAKSAST